MFTAEQATPQSVVTSSLIFSSCSHSHGLHAPHMCISPLTHPPNLCSHLAQQMVKSLKKAMAPVLSDVTVEWVFPETAEVLISPVSTSSLFPGERLVGYGIVCDASLYISNPRTVSILEIPGDGGGPEPCPQSHPWLLTLPHPDCLFVAARNQLDLGLLLWGIGHRCSVNGDTAWINATLSVCASLAPLQLKNLGNMFKR